MNPQTKQIGIKTHWHHNTSKKTSTRVIWHEYETHYDKQTKTKKKTKKQNEGELGCSRRVKVD
jgi:hypothetical protein